MKRKKLLTIAGISLFVIALFTIYGVTQTQIFELGYKPYGESPNQITTDRYWNIQGIDTSTTTSTLEGNDFNLIIGGGYKATAITTEVFSDRTFRTTLIASVGSCSRSPCVFGSSNFKVYLGNNLVLEKSISGDGAILEGVLEIIPSPIDNNVEIFWAGSKVKEINIEDDYKIRIDFTSSASFQSGTNAAYASNPTSIIRNPSYKQQYGCTKLPNEQYYVKVFNEGDMINLGDLSYFEKFCLDEAPLSIYTNTGSTTDKNALINLVNDETLEVPLGHIWVVEYIGEIQSPETICEEGVYNLDENQCMSRTAITFDFGQDTEIIIDNDTDEVTITIDTEPIIYITDSIKTHQEFERSNEILFSQIIQDGESLENSFVIGKETFTSNYNGENSFSFSYNGNSYIAIKGKEYVIDDYLSVKIIDIQDDSDVGEFSDAKIDYVFSLDNNFAELSYIEGEVTINNLYQEFNGGLTITKEDIVGTTSIENKDMILNEGETFYYINLEEIRELKIKPYIYVQTPDFKYTFDLSKSIDLSTNIEGEVESKIQKDFNILLLVIPLLIIIILGLSSFIAFKFIKRRK